MKGSGFDTVRHASGRLPVPCLHPSDMGPRSGEGLVQSARPYGVKVDKARKGAIVAGRFLFPVSCPRAVVSVCRKFPPPSKAPVPSDLGVHSIRQGRQSIQHLKGVLLCCRMNYQNMQWNRAKSSTWNTGLSPRCLSSMVRAGASDDAPEHVRAAESRVLRKAQKGNFPNGEGHERER
jgi:hypothetical protein